MNAPCFRPLGMYCNLSEESLEELVRIGFTHICAGGIDWENDEELRKARSLLKAWSEHIQPYSVHYSCLFNSLDFPVDEVADRLSEWMLKAATLGIRWGVIHPRPGALPDWRNGPEPQVLQAFEDRLVTCLEKVAQRTCSSGTGLSLENDIWDRRVWNWLCTGKDLKRVVSRVGAKNIGICLDMGHVPISGLDPAATILEMGEYLVDTHFNDSFGYFPGRTVWDCDVHIPIGLGMVNWVEVMDALEAIGFTHPICFEAGSQVYPHDAARICFSNWRAIELARWRWDCFGNRPGGGTGPRAAHTSIPRPGSE